MYVSSMNRRSSMQARAPIMPVMYSVHLHPRYDCVMNAPAIGEMKGPRNTNAEKPAIATPLVSLPNISLNAPPTTANGHEAKTPAKNRDNISVWKSLAVAAANMKQVKIKQATVIGIFRPYNSDKGAHARGPVAKPQMYSVNPRIATTWLTPKIMDTGSTAEL